MVRIFLGRDKDGKRHYYNKMISGSKKDAQVHLTEKRRELDTGTFIRPTKQTKQTLRSYLAEWISTKKANARTLNDYHGIIRRYVEPDTIARVRVDLLTPATIRRFYLDLQKRGLAPRTVQYAHSVLHTALEQAVTDGLIPRNPSKAARNVLDRVERSERQVLSVEQARTFLTAVEGDRFAALWLLLLDTGLRPAEALGLKWTDLDDGVLRIQRALKEPRGKEEGWRLERPKTKQAIRSIPLMARTLEALRQHRKRQAEEKLKLGKAWGEGSEPDMIFTTTTGTYPRLANLHRRHFKPVLAAAQLPDMRIYDLRHSAASILLALGENPKVVQERLGHRDVALTLNTYSHVVDGLQQQATAKLESAFGGDRVHKPRG